MTRVKQPESIAAPVAGVRQLNDVHAVLEGLKTVAECMRDIEREKSKQAQIKEDARVDIHRIDAMRDVLMSYLDQSFDERKENFEKLFQRLDSAIATDNVQLASAVLDSVVKLADASPFEALKDPAAARAMLGDKNIEWKF